ALGTHYFRVGFQKPAPAKAGGYAFGGGPGGKAPRLTGAAQGTKPMSITFASERRLVADDEFEPIVRSHYPVVEELSREELVELARWLRERRARARDIVRGRRRVARGKADARGGTADTASERGLLAKKQVYASALRRVNA